MAKKIDPLILPQPIQEAIKNISPKQIATPINSTAGPLGQPNTPFTNAVNNAKASTMQSKAPPETKTSGGGNSMDGVIRGEFGQISGMLIGGKAYLGMTPQDVEKLSAGRLSATKGGSATQTLEAVTAQQQADAQQQQIAQQNAGLANEVLNPVATPTGQATDLSQEQATYAAARGIIPSVIAGATGGAALGSIPAVATAGLSIPTGAILGAIGGLTIGVFRAVTSNLQQQATDSISSQSKILSDGKQNLKKLIALTKANPQLADRYLTAYQQQKSKMAEAYSNLKLDTSRNSYKFLSKDGTLALQGFENYYADGGLNQIYDSNMQLAILGKNPDMTDLMMYADEVQE
jgi:hypothetical protein